jgi:pimeloyl-ACP methyl ester carboxylesterase
LHCFLATATSQERAVMQSLNRIVVLRRAKSVGLVLLTLVLQACAIGAQGSKAIRLDAREIPARRLAIVLPGRYDTPEGLNRRGVAQTIQREWPDADVILSGLGLRDYWTRQAPHRIEREYVAPARAAGYREVWLVGASLGGLGALLHDRHYPASVDGIILLGPYLGDDRIFNEIQQAGGVAAWTPVERSESSADWQRALWSHLRSWSYSSSDVPTRVWLIYGKSDPLARGAQVLAPLLPPSQVLPRVGGHAWSVWDPGLREALSQIGDSATSRHVADEDRE